MLLCGEDASLHGVRVLRSLTCFDSEIVINYDFYRSVQAVNSVTGVQGFPGLQEQMMLRKVANFFTGKHRMKIALILTNKKV